MQSPPPFRAPGRFLRRSSLLCVTVALSTLASPLKAQLPATSPAASPTQPPPARPPHRSQITFERGLLTVSASNASLNGLIREIARQTGMKVTGAVAEDRVFGTYGPADPQRVLATLLDGTGSNILIRSGATDAPLELILTPRTGAPTPPNPNANLAGNDQDDDGSPPPGSPISPAAAMRGRQAVLPGSSPIPPPAANQTSQPAPDDAAVIPAASAQPPAAGTDPGTSGDAVKTPQQIFEQLQRLRQQSTPNAQTPQ